MGDEAKEAKEPKAAWKIKMVKFPNGTEYRFGPITFSAEAAELMASASEIEEQGVKRALRVMKSLRICAVEAMVAGGHTRDEIEEAFSSVVLREEAGVGEFLQTLMKGLVGE